MITVSAAVKLIPRPPALVQRRKTNLSDPEKSTVMKRYGKGYRTRFRVSIDSSLSHISSYISINSFESVLLRDEEFLD